MTTGKIWLIERLHTFDTRASTGRALQFALTAPGIPGSKWTLRIGIRIPTEERRWTLASRRLAAPVILLIMNTAEQALAGLVRGHEAILYDIWRLTSLCVLTG